MIHLRPAQCSDADAIAYLHTAGWRDTYTKVMSSDFLENQAQEDRLSHWRSAMNQRGERERVFVANTMERLKDSYVSNSTMTLSGLLYRQPACKLFATW